MDECKSLAGGGRHAAVPPHAPPRGDGGWAPRITPAPPRYPRSLPTRLRERGNTGGVDGFFQRGGALCVAAEHYEKRTLQRGAP